MTLRETLTGLRDRASTPKARAEYEEELSCPPMPPSMAYLWTWFLELHRRRGGGGMGPAEITFREIEAWCGLRRLRLTVWELEVILSLDDVWMAAQVARE